MTLEKQLLRLLQRRRLEMNVAARDYTRLKRQLNPDRFLRRHMGTALATAGILGLMVAPGPAARRRPHHGRFRFLFRALQWTLTKLRPPVPASAPTAAAPDRTTTAPASHSPESFLDLLPTLIGQLDWEAILRAFISGIQHRHTTAEQSEETGTHEHNGHRPPAAPSPPAESPQPESP